MGKESCSIFLLYTYGFYGKLLLHEINDIWYYLLLIEVAHYCLSIYTERGITIYNICSTQKKANEF